MLRKGYKRYNLALGDRRANAAKDYLMTQGISASRITTISFGKKDQLTVHLIIKHGLKIDVL